MKESVRTALLNTKVIDIEVKENTITFFLENEKGACYSVQVNSNDTSTILLKE
jgi:hypothetical protein